MQHTRQLGVGLGFCRRFLAGGCGRPDSDGERAQRLLGLPSSLLGGGLALKLYEAEPSKLFFVTIPHQAHFEHFPEFAEVFQHGKIRCWFLEATHKDVMAQLNTTGTKHNGATYRGHWASRLDLDLQVAITIAIISFLLEAVAEIMILNDTTQY